MSTTFAIDTKSSIFVPPVRPSNTQCRRMVPEVIGGSSPPVTFVINPAVDGPFVFFVFLSTFFSNSFSTMKAKFIKI